MSTLFRLIYISAETAPLTQAGIDDLLAASHASNTRDGISGNLLRASGTFAQLIEGPISVVERTFLRIEWDRRHTDVHVVHRGAIDKRAAPVRPMGYCDLATLPADERQRLGPSVRDGFRRVAPGLDVVMEGELLSAFGSIFGAGTEAAAENGWPG